MKIKIDSVELLHMSSSTIALIGKKLGMSVYFEGTRAVPVTLIEVLPNTLLGVKKYPNFTSLVITGGELKKKSKINKPQRSVFESSNVFNDNDKGVCSAVKEFRLSGDVASLSSGTKFVVGDFLIGSVVDVRSVSQGKGFQGGMKRHGFAGMPATHGVSLTHRSIGSTGNRSLPGKVFKNKKMAGHMGASNVCVQNLVIKFADSENHIIAVAGSVPGAKNSVVYIKSAVKKSFRSSKLVINGLSEGQV